MWMDKKFKKWTMFTTVFLSFMFLAIYVLSTTINITYPSDGATFETRDSTKDIDVEFFLNESSGDTVESCCVKREPNTFEEEIVLDDYHEIFFEQYSTSDYESPLPEGGWLGFWINFNEDNVLKQAEFDTDLNFLGNTYDLEHTINMTGYQEYNFEIEAMINESGNVFISFENVSTGQSTIYETCIGCDKKVPDAIYPINEVNSIEYLLRDETYYYAGSRHDAVYQYYRNWTYTGNSYILSSTGYNFTDFEYDEMSGHFFGITTKDENNEQYIIEYDNFSVLNEQDRMYLSNDTKYGVWGNLGFNYDLDGYNETNLVVISEETSGDIYVQKYTIYPDNILACNESSLNKEGSNTITAPFNLGDTTDYYVECLDSSNHYINGTDSQSLTVNYDDIFELRYPINSENVQSSNITYIYYVDNLTGDVDDRIVENVSLILNDNYVKGNQSVLTDNDNNTITYDVEGILNNGENDWCIEALYNNSATQTTCNNFIYFSPTPQIGRAHV